jgi:hypothetical protein
VVRPADEPVQRPLVPPDRHRPAQWRGLVATTVEEARELGELAADTDADQLTFELIAFLETANAMSLLHDDAQSYERARTAIRTRLVAR